MPSPKSTPTHRRHHPLHDYHQACIYHITLVCSDRAQALGCIVGDTLAEARCELTPLGAEISQCIRGIETHGSQHGRKLQVIAKAVMPDHIHFVLYVQERLTDCTLGDIIRGFKHSCNKALRAALAAQERAEAAGTQGVAASSASASAPVSLHAMAADSHDERQPNTATPLSDERQPTAATPLSDLQQPNTAAPLSDPRQPNAATPTSASDADRVSCSSLPSEDVSRPVTAPSSAPQPAAAPPTAIPAAPHGYRQPALPIRSPRMLAGHALFEENYDETILRRRGQLRAMIDYVHNNPKHRWQKQRHPDLLIPIRGIQIAGRQYDAIGNITLLGLARHQVWVRSRWDEATRRNYQNDCVLKARHFHVLVSPFISPHEAAVRDVALREGHSVIVLIDNGFSDFTQCPSITRAECVMLNARAAEIAGEA